ncbi:MAG TPA: DUF1501 domain-containing protein [Planctomycetaceae bacterium]|nr:DUF1501 domain-containing protein [Planctomycetaceae bacterium]
MGPSRVNVASVTCLPAAATRRDCLRAGALSLLGLTAADLLKLRASAQAPATHSAARHNSCVFVFLFGGPSHIDLWDMKPLAPLEIRGEFRPIETSVPGIHVCEHLPLLAGQMDKLCLLRSMTHRMNVHGPACSEMYTGREYFGPPVTDQATPEDWPSLSSLVMRYGSPAGGLPSSIVLPWYTQFVGQDRRIAGQTGGRMGENWNPFLVDDDPSRPDFEVQGLQLPPDVPAARFERRTELLRRFGERAGPRLAATPVTRLTDRHRRTAVSIVRQAGRTEAFALQREPESVRQRYGPTKFGQSLLLARRLIERGSLLVTVNWDDDTRSDKVSPHWDTHHQNFPRLKDGLCPVFDRAFSAFLQDLDSHGLLETTLVVALGEFGRTPQIGLVTQNGMTEKTGRDHWPHAFTALLAGGGVRGGQVYGATNSTGGYVAEKPVSPADLAATILLHLGVDPAATYADEFQRVPRRLCEGRPLTDLG